MAASSTTSAVPAWGPWPGRDHRRASECSVLASIPVPASSSTAARADGAAPTGSKPADVKAWRMAARV